MVFNVALDKVLGVLPIASSSSLLSSALEYMSQLPVDDNETIDKLRSWGRCGWRLMFIHCSTSAVGFSSGLCFLEALFQPGLLEVGLAFNAVGALVTSIFGVARSRRMSCAFRNNIELHVFVGNCFDLEETASLTSNNADESNVKAADV